MNRGSFIPLFALVTALFVSAPSQATDEYFLNIKNHRFDPTELTIPAGAKVKLIVKNHDATPEEFESFDLHREKLVTGGGQAVIYLGPLKPGIYKFFGEFNTETAKGRIIVK